MTPEQLAQLQAEAQFDPSLMAQLQQYMATQASGPASLADVQMPGTYNSAEGNPDPYGEGKYIQQLGQLGYTPISGQIGDPATSPDSLKYFNETYGLNLQTPEDYYRYLYPNAGGVTNDPRLGQLLNVGTNPTGVRSLEYNPNPNEELMMALKAGGLAFGGAGLLSSLAGGGGLFSGMTNPFSGMSNPFSSLSNLFGGEGTSAFPGGIGNAPGINLPGSGFLNVGANAAEGVAGGGAMDASSLFDWGGGLAEDAGLSANDWMAQQIAQGGGDLGSLLTPGTTSLSGLPWSQIAKAVSPFSGQGGSSGSEGLGGLFPNASLASLLGGALQGGLGYFGAKQQQDAMRDMQNQWLALGAPSRARYEASFAPGYSVFDDSATKDAATRAADVAARSYSASAGNPFDSQTAQAGIYNQVLSGVALPQLNAYRSQNLTGGQLGVNTAGTAGLAGAQNAGGGLNAIGYGLNSALNPQPSLADLLKQNKIGFG